MEVLLHLDMGNGHVETLEEVEVTHLPRVNDTIALVLPKDNKVSNYVVTHVKHEFVQGSLRIFKQRQIEITAYRKET